MNPVLADRGRKRSYGDENYVYYINYLINESP